VRILLPLAAIVMMLCYLITPDEPGKEYDKIVTAPAVQEPNIAAEIDVDEPAEAVAERGFCPVLESHGGILPTWDLEERRFRSSNFWW
jgi:hypothetical protein